MTAETFTVSRSTYQLLAQLAHAAAEYHDAADDSAQAAREATFEKSGEPRRGPRRAAGLAAMRREAIGGHLNAAGHVMRLALDLAEQFAGDELEATPAPIT